MNLLFEIRYCLIGLLKDKHFCVTALLTLALCIGGNTAIFSMLNTLVLQPLPFADSKKIVEIYNTYAGTAADRDSSNIPLFLDYSENTDVFSHLALIKDFAANMGGEDLSQRVTGLKVTPQFFAIFKVAPHMGAFFRTEHRVRGQDAVVVLGYSLWKHQFAGDRDIVGRQIILNGQTNEIIGVAPRSMEALFPSPKTTVYKPYAWRSSEVHPSARHFNNARLFGRLKPRGTVRAAQRQVDHRDQIYYETTPHDRDFLDRTQHKSKVITLHKERVRYHKTALYLLQLGALFVLLIGCVNIANLLLVRSNARQQEFAIRCAIGARPITIGRQLLIESLLLFVAGGVNSILFGAWFIKLANSYAMDMLPPMQPLRLDAAAVVFALLLAILFGFITAILPIARILSRDLIKSLTQSNRGISGSKSMRLLSSGFVSAQIALALVLTIGSGLLWLSYAKVVQRDYGFDPYNVTVARIHLSNPMYRDGDKIRTMQNRLLEAIQTIPGVDSAALGSALPTQGGYSYNLFSIYGYELTEGEDILAASRMSVSPDFMRTLDIEILQGRSFSAADLADTRHHVIIDKNLANRYFINKNPIGHKLGFVGPDTAEEKWPIVIGVAESAQHRQLDEKQRTPFIYENLQQKPRRQIALYIKSAIASETLLPMVRQRLQDIDPDLALYSTGKLRDYLNKSLNSRRVILFLLLAFAAVAVALSAIGIYGIVAYTVRQETREIGIRIALGANNVHIFAKVFKMTFIKTGIGVLLGISGAIALARQISTMLYEVDTIDPIVYCLAAATVFIISIAASYIPAKRATQIQPMQTLKAE